VGTSCLRCVAGLWRKGYDCVNCAERAGRAGALFAARCLAVAAGKFFSHKFRHACHASTIPQISQISQRGSIK